MRILIIGGGLSGLSAAVALAGRGHDVNVAELTGRIDGAVIAITNRAVEALEALGVLEEAMALGFVIDGTASIFSRVYDGAGDPLPIPPPPPRTDTRLPASISLMRADLAGILTKAAIASGASVRIGRTIVVIRAEADGALATFDDGSIERFDLIVGADGIQSTVRGLAFPDAPQPAYTGHMSFRWMVPDGPPGAAGPYTLPDNSMIMSTRLPGNLVYLSTGVDMPRRHLPSQEVRALLRGILDRFTAPFLRALLARLDERQEITARPYDWLLVPPPWHRGRIVLIGDAVHATTAHLASGGSLAIEDAVVLAEELGNGADVDAALARFSERRFARAELVVEASVELLRLQQSHADRAASAALRAKAVEALREPY